MTSVFYRADAPVVAVKAVGSWITDANGKRYLDAAGGAVVSAVGHGRKEVIDAIASQLGDVDYVHANTFTTEATEAYCTDVASRVPMTGAKVFPVSGGSEAIETALKMARTYQILTGHPERLDILARWGSYHGNTLGALDLSGRPALRAPYQEWLGRFGHLPAVYEYRCPAPGHPLECGRWHAAQLEEAVKRHHPAAFFAEPIVGASLGACVPPDDYWPLVAEVCRRHDVLLIADEVMTGFGRTGRFWATDHWNLTPDVIVAGKGASGGYWPLGLTIVSQRVADVIAGRFVHGFTNSHHPGAAAAGRAVLGIIDAEGLVATAARVGDSLIDDLRVALAENPYVGDVRGRGMLIGIEFVADRGTKTPFAREQRITEKLLAAARVEGLLLYPAAHGIDGKAGDAILLGPPLNLSGTERDFLIGRLVAALTPMSAVFRPN